jgi:hypothetical protein
LSQFVVSATYILFPFFFPVYARTWVCLHESLQRSLDSLSLHFPARSC